MAIVQGLFALLARQAGRLLNTAFGWATTLLFGKVPEERQIYLSVIALGSVAWLVALLGILFPDFGTFLLAFIPLPEWVNETWIRLAMLVAAILIPLIVGVVGLRMLDPEDRPGSAAATGKNILKGYPYTLGLAVTLIMMTVFAPILKIQTLIKRWTSQHVPVIVESEDYLEIVGEIQETLRKRGWPTRRRPASRMLRWPTKVLTMLAGGSVENLVADKLTTLKGDQLEVLLHPSDLVISGKEADVIHARAAVVQQLGFSKAYLTWTKEGNGLEDRIRRLWREQQAKSGRGVPAATLAQLEAIERDLTQAKLPFEEWEVLFREKQQVETGLLQTMAGMTRQPTAPAELPPDAAEGTTAKPVSSRSGGPMSSRLTGMLVFTGLILLKRSAPTGYAGSVKGMNRADV